MLGSAEPSCIWACAGSEKCMFIQPDLCWPSKIPFPWNENEPAVPAVIDAWKSNRDDCVFAVVLAAFATGSSASASPPAQPTSAEAQRARASRERTRRGVIHPSDRRASAALLSLERGKVGPPALGVLAEEGRLARGDGRAEPFGRLGQSC